MKKPTHFYKTAWGHLRFVTLTEKRKGEFATSDGMWAYSVGVKPVSELYGKTVELDGVFGTLMEALTDEHQLETKMSLDTGGPCDYIKMLLKKYPHLKGNPQSETEPKLVFTEKKGGTFKSQLVRVYWHQGQKHSHPTWVNVNKLKFV